MSLASGSKLGSYEIVDPIGAGGMGEVYRARDTKLGREVAIKVLPEAFAQNEERLARFEREARLLASLNHPNIATLYGLEHSDGVVFLAMVAYATFGALPEGVRFFPLAVLATGLLLSWRFRRSRMGRRDRLRNGAQAAAGDGAKHLHAPRPSPVQPDRKADPTGRRLSPEAELRRRRDREPVRSQPGR